MNAHTSIILLAALYHESCRHAVQQGQTLAHAVGQPCSFTEFADLPPDALRGRMLTAELLLRTHDFEPLPPMGDAARGEPNVDALARAIHQAERGAVRRGWVAVKLDPPRPWLAFEGLPEAAQNGRRHQARFFLARFSVRPRQGDPLQDFDRARAVFLAGPAYDAARARCLTSGGSPELRWTGTPAEVEHHLAAAEEYLGIPLVVAPLRLQTPWWTAGPIAPLPPNYRGMWNGVALYEGERGGGFAAEGVGGFTDRETGLWIETTTEGSGTLVGTGRGHELGPVHHDLEVRAGSGTAVGRPDCRKCADVRQAVERQAHAAPARSHEQKLLNRARRHMSVALGLMDEALTSARRTLADDALAKASYQVALASACTGQLDPHAVRIAARMGFTLEGLADIGVTVVLLPDPSGAPDDPAADVAAMHVIGAVAKAQDALVGAADAVQAVTDHGLLAMLQDVASKSIERLSGLAPSVSETERRAREYIAAFRQGEPAIRHEQALRARREAKRRST